MTDIIPLGTRAVAMMENLMKAMVYHHYGGPEVLELAEVEKPVVRDAEVLVRIHAASVNWLDLHFLSGTPFLARLMAGLFKPRNPILGIDFAGRVDMVGAHVTQLQPGAEVFGSSSHGCFAEYLSVSEDDVVRKPTNITFEDAATVSAAASTALHALRDFGRARSGQRILINGASGGVGTFAVQIARFFGAEVTGVCSTRNADLVRSIGANEVIDYTREDFTENEALYDVIFDTVAKRSFSDCQRVLRLNGIYVTTEFSPLLALQGRWIAMVGSKRMVPLPPKPPVKEDLVFLKDLLELGAITPVVDRCYPLHQVPDALGYLEQGHTRGKVAISMVPG